MERILKLPQIQQRTQEWYEKRQNLLTASEIASVLSISPFQSKKKLMQKKIHKLNEQKNNPLLYHGNKFEQTAIDLFKTTYCIDVHEVGLVVHDAFDWLGGSPDGVTSDDCLIEIKCPLKKKITHDVPKYYYTQIQLCLEICKVDYCYFVQYKPCSIYENGILDVIKVKRDPMWFEKNLPIFQEFWNSVLLERSKNTSETFNSNKKIQHVQVRNEEIVCLIDPNVE